MTDNKPKITHFGKIEGLPDGRISITKFAIDDGGINMGFQATLLSLIIEKLIELQLEGEPKTICEVNIKDNTIKYGELHG